MTVVSINQPAYLPWMGYFDRIAKSDLHVVLDHVQFEKGSFTNRTRIRQRDGRLMWLTVPVEKGKPINETRVVDAFRVKHLRALGQAYGYEPWWLTGSLSQLLIATLEDSTEDLLEQLGTRTRLIKSSWLESRGAKSELVLNLCKEVGATTYLSGPQGRNYLDLPSFEKAGIKVAWHDYTDPDDPPLSAVHHLFAKEAAWR